MSWPEAVERWKKAYGCVSLAPVVEELLTVTLAALNVDHADLRQFYRAANGLSLEWFTVLPIEDPRDIKRTWDGLNRANDPTRTKHLGGDLEMLQRFLVFAKLDASNCVALDRGDGSIWYQEHGEIHQTDLPLEDFIETTLKEVTEL